MKVRPLIVLSLLVGSCAGNSDASTGALPPASSSTVIGIDPTPTVADAAVVSTVAPVAEAVLIGAGDIAVSGGKQAETAALIELFPDATVFTTGDNAYPDGAITEFTEHYEPTWGAFRDRTRPSIGNHDAHTEEAAAYFEYFGSRAGNPGEGWYSYNLGGWHVIVLNSDCGVRGLASCEQQLTWLEKDLVENGQPCMLAYWHKPVFNAGKHPDFDSFQGEWATLDAADVDLVINGHDHNYQRFAPQNAEGVESAEGIREFIVGSGGAGIYTQTKTPPNLEVFYEGHGALKLDLFDSYYRWAFLGTSGSIEDSGTASCSGG